MFFISDILIFNSDVRSFFGREIQTTEVKKCARSQETGENVILD